MASDSNSFPVSGWFGFVGVLRERRMSNKVLKEKNLVSSFLFAVEKFRVVPFFFASFFSLTKAAVIF